MTDLDEVRKRGEIASRVQEIDVMMEIIRRERAASFTMGLGIPGTPTILLPLTDPVLATLELARDNLLKELEG